MKKVLLLGIVLLVLVIGGALTFVAMTQTGLQWTFAMAARAMPDTLSIDSLEGRLLGPIAVHGLHFDSPSLDITIQNGRIEWQPAALWRGTLRFTTVSADGIALSVKQAQTSPSQLEQLAAVKLPVAVELQDLRLAQVTVQTAADSQFLDEITLRAHMSGARLTLDSLALRAPAYQLQARATLTTTGDYPLDGHVSWQARPDGYAPIQGVASLSGSLTQLNVQHTFTGAVEAELQAVITHAVTTPRWQASMQIQRLQTTDLNPDWAAAELTGDVSSSGEPAAFTVEAILATHLQKIGQSTALLQLKIADRMVQLTRLELKQPDTNAALQATGNWHWADDSFELNGQWQDLVWPSQDALWRSPHGQLSVNGQLDAYQYDMETAFGGTELPDTLLSTRGNGNRQGLMIEMLKAITLDGQLDGSGELSWQPQLAWQLSLQGKEINPGVQWAGWPGRVGGSFQLRGKHVADAIDIGIDLTQITGQLRNYPVRAQGRVAWDGNNLDVEKLQLQSGSAQLQLAGNLKEQWDMRWTVQADDLQTVLPDAGGKLHATGSLRGPRYTPHLQTAFTAQQLRLGDSRVATLTGTTDIDLSPTGEVQLAAEVSGLRLFGHDWQRGMLEGKGSVAAHTLSLQTSKGVKDAEAVTLRLDAGLANNTWAGRLQQADIAIAPWGQWSLAEPGHFSFGPQQAKLGDWCWLQAESRLCVAAQRDASTWKGALTTASVPLQYIQPWLPADIQLTGNMDGHATGHWQTIQQLTGRAELSTTAGQVRLLVGEAEQTLEFAPGKLAASLDKDALTAELSLPLLDSGRIDANVRLPDWQPQRGMHARQQLQGKMQARLSSLALIGRFIPEVDNLQGVIDANLTLEGHYAQPQLSGHASLQQASAALPRLGVRLTDISADIRSGPDNALDYTASLTAGEGRLQLTGRTLLNPVAGWPTTAQLRGTDLTVADIPEALLVISPALELKISDNQIRLEGEVKVPHARLQPRQLPEGALSTSRDVVIVHSDQKDNARSPVQWNLHSNVRLVLGERVQFDGFGLRGRFVGDLLLIEKPGKLTLGRGELGIVDGVYQAYGQDLTIERGRLLFTDTEIEDPGLDVRAVRKSGEVTAGLRIGGTLKQPIQTLFSQPSMNDAEILSYLLLGRPLRSASGEEGSMLASAATAFGLVQGESLAKKIGATFGLDEVRVGSSGNGLEQTAVVLGRYLSPKLYLRYAAGLFETSNLVQLQYELNRRVQIQTETGTRTGVDIFYTFER